MNKILKIRTNLFRLVISELFTGNNLSINLILFLGALTFAVITVDLSTDLSVEKDEITQVVATLTKSINTINVDSLNWLIIKPELVGLIPPISFTFTNNEDISLPPNRAPPSVI